MHSAFLYDQYFLRRQVFALTGKVRIYSPTMQLLMYSEQKMFRLKEDISVFSDESKSQPLLHIKARQIIDFSAAYDVNDSLENNRVGTIRRKGFRSLIRDRWEILNSQEQLMGVFEEDSTGMALVRRFLLSLIPLNYNILFDGKPVGDVRQRFNPFRYELNVDFSMDKEGQLDRRLGIASAVLLATIEGRQE